MGALRDFVADMLESEGAAIEPVEPDGLEVLAPPSVRAVLGWPEFARLGFAATRPTGAIPTDVDTLPLACVPLHRHLRRKARGTGLAWLQPGYRRGHGRRLSAAPPHVLSERRGLAGARPGHPTHRERGVGCGNSHSAC
jgi:hypothetical protein